MIRSPADQASRTEVLDTQRSFIVEAPAGSGKTTLLIQRFLKLLAIADEPEEIVAITFTRKATEQMRNKLLAQLRQARQRAAGGPALDELDEKENALDKSLSKLAAEVTRRDAERCWNLCEQPQRLRIATIDSFSAEIAGRLPLLARLGSTLQPTDRPEAMYRVAARKTLERLADPTPLGTAVKTLLVEQDSDLQRCQQMIAQMLACRTQWRALLGRGGSLDDPAVEQDLRSMLEAAPRHAVAQCLSTLSTHLNRQDCKLLHDLLLYAATQKPEFVEGPGWPHEHDFSLPCAERWRLITNFLLTANGKPKWYERVTKTQGFPAGSPEQQKLAAFIDRHAGNFDLLECLKSIRTMPSVAYSDEQWQILKAYIRVLTYAVAQLKVVFAESGTVDFSEIAVAAVNALVDNETETDIAAAFGTRVRHLLIDELQDTSAIQYDLLKALTVSWDGSSQTLFVVGDPKQSIYGFRQAEVHLFRRMQRHGLGRLKLNNSLLTSNFRSQAALVDEWNRGFSDIFTQKHADDIPFTFATAERPCNRRVGMEVHPSILEEDTADAKQQAEREHARKICSIIRNRVAAHRGASQLKIAVLARVRMHLPVLLDEFRNHGIPYRALDIDALGDMQEVRDVVALTRCLLHPSDRIAWLAVLRAPWCGLMLADLHALFHGDDLSTRDACVGEMLEQDLSALTPEGRTRCTRLREVLRAALSARNRISVAALVERTWHSLGGPACASPQQRENIERYFQFLREVERDNALNDFRALEELLARFFAIPQSFNPGETVVDVLTIHGAKGLEWDIVFVPELQRKGASDNSRLLNWIEYPALEHGVVLAAAGEADSPDDLFYRWFCSKRKQQQEAERKRLFYVACTRAREELHLFGTLSLKEDGECVSPHSDSLLATGWPMLESQFLQATSKKREAAPQIGSNLLLFPSLKEAFPGVLPALAATATDVVQLNQRRLPTGWHPPAAGKSLMWTRAAVPAQEPRLSTPFVRAEGSILARTTGDAIHRFLEKITRDFAAGMTLPEIEARVSAKTIASVVRALGVSPDAQRAISTAVSTALQKTLRDPVALWLLGPRRNAITEAAISAETQGAFRTARVDRAFLAGDAPNAPGEDTLWLVDYKTGETGRLQIEEFLLEQQQFYSSQLTTYARLLQPLFPDASKIRLGLYFPSLGRLQHWNWSEESEQP